MRKELNDLRAFHEAFGCVINEEPTIPDKQTALLRAKLCVSEVSELVEAMAEENIVEVFDAIIDSLYVLIGTAHSYGLAQYLRSGFAQVHANNMSKLGPDGKPLKDSSGKVVKPEGYKKVDLSWIKTVADYKKPLPPGILDQIEYHYDLAAHPDCFGISCSDCGDPGETCGKCKEVCQKCPHLTLCVEAKGKPDQWFGNVKIDTNLSAADVIKDDLKAVGIDVDKPIASVCPPPLPESPSVNTVPDEDIILFLEQSTSAPANWPNNVKKVALEIEAYCVANNIMLFEFEYSDAHWVSVDTIRYSIGSYTRFNEIPHRLKKGVWPVKDERTIEKI